MTDLQAIRDRLKADAGESARSGYQSLMRAMIASVGAIALGFFAFHYLLLPLVVTVTLAPLRPPSAS